MEKGSKRDRFMRLVKIYFVLSEHPKGLRAEELARFCNVSKRTAYRDINALDMELGVPLYPDGARYRVDDSHFLRPIAFTVHEAVALFLAARLMTRFCDERHEAIVNAFIKLAGALDEPIKGQIALVALALSRKEPDPDYARTMEILASAWATGTTVRIWYPAGGTGEPEARLLDPYFLEPSAGGHSCYVIGFCHQKDCLRTFKVERIAGIESTAMRYQIPADFDIEERLRYSWGVVADGEPVEVRLLFSPSVHRRVRESVWHASQRLETQKDGSLLFVVRVDGTMEIRPWILSWGDSVQVLEPPELRKEIASVAQRMAAVYSSRLM